MRKLCSIATVPEITLALIAPLLALPASVYAQVPSVTCQTVMVPMRDGTLLTSDVYMPAQPGKYPVVLQRNPYARLSGGGCFVGGEAGLGYWPQNGYVAINQDVRGTFTSQGTFRAMAQEAQDGYDAVEWAAKQPWSTGKVGVMSASYLGVTSWQAAIYSPPHLAAIAPGLTGSDYHDNWTYQNGVFDLWFGLSWPGLTFVPDQIVRAGQAEGLPQTQVDQQVAAWDSNYKQNLLTNWAWQLPLESFSQFHQLAPYYYDWIDHPNYDSYWAAMDVETRYADVKVPALIGGASYDPFNVGQVRNFQGMRTHGGTTETRNGTKLVWQAYGHAGDSGTPTFGADTSALVTAPSPAGGLSGPLQLRFFDHYLKGIDNGVDHDPRVYLYVLLPLSLTGVLEPPMIGLMAPV
jgi:putative CocE/NonD family hydrolase